MLTNIVWTAAGKCEPGGMNFEGALDLMVPGAGAGGLL